MKERKEISTRKINSNLNSLEELVSTLEQKELDISKGIFRKPEFTQIKENYSLALSRLKSLGEDVLEYEERYESLIRRSEALFSLYIAYRKSRINPVKRRKPVYSNNNFSNGVDDPHRSGIRVIPVEDLVTNIQNSYY